MSDQTPDPTAWSDGQLDDLLDALAKRAEQRDDLDLPGSGPNRRTVLATLLGAGGLGVGATQLGAAASWGSASGTIGTDSEPVDQANIRDLDAKLASASGMGRADAFLDSRKTASTGSPTQIVSTVGADNANDLDSSGSITPHKTARFAINAAAKVRPTNSGDRLQLRLQNVTDGVTVKNLADRTIQSTGDTILTASVDVRLDSSKEYQVQAENVFSQLELISQKINTWLTLSELMSQ